MSTQNDLKSGNLRWRINQQDMQKGPSDADLQAVSAFFLKDLKELEALQKWEHVDDKPVAISKIERSERVVTKAQTVVKLSIDTLANFFSDPLYMKKMTDRVLKAEVVYKGPGFHVVQFVMKGFAFVSDREMVIVFTFHREGDKIYLGNRSCEYPVPIDKDVVRAFTHCAGNILEKIDENTTRITNIGDIDMNGSIPDFVKNKVALMRATALSELQQKIKAAIK